jgi:hypothetical protein
MCRTRPTRPVPAHPTRTCNRELAPPRCCFLSLPHPRCRPRPPSLPQYRPRLRNLPHRQRPETLRRHPHPLFRPRRGNLRHRLRHPYLPRSRSRPSRPHPRRRFPPNLPRRRSPRSRSRPQLKCRSRPRRPKSSYPAPPSSRPCRHRPQRSSQGARELRTVERREPLSCPITSSGFHGQCRRHSKRLMTEEDSEGISQHQIYEIPPLSLYPTRGCPRAG